MLILIHGSDDERREEMSTNMKSRGRRFIFCIASIILSASMVLTMMPSAAYAAASSSGGNTLTRGEFTFAPHLIENKDLKDDYIYSDDYFNGSGYAYNAHLATMSMILASASISSHGRPGIYSKKEKKQRQR